MADKMEANTRAQDALASALGYLDSVAIILRDSDLPGLEDVRQAEMSLQNAWRKLVEEA